MEAGGSYYHYGQPKNLHADSANIEHPQQAGPQGMFGVQTQLSGTILHLMLSRHAVHADAA